MTANTDPFRFEARDAYGEDFWVEFDGAAGHGFWIGDPKNRIPLSMDVTVELIRWIRDNWSGGLS